MFMLACTLAVLAVDPAAAQRSSIDRARLTADLVAQGDAAIIRERRLADDRVLILINEHEQRIRELATEKRGLEIQLSRSEGEKQKLGRRLQAVDGELNLLRKKYADLVANSAKRDALWAVEREAFRAEAAQIVAQATPEKLAALRRFADGDRRRAYEIIAELTGASVKARQTAANLRAAPEVRLQAELLAIMYANGEAIVQSWHWSSAVSGGS